MAAAAEKRDRETEGAEDAVEPPRPSEAATDAAPMSSPALALQSGLAAELAGPRDDHYPPRLVTGFVIAFCGAAWAGALMTYSTLF